MSLGGFDSDRAVRERNKRASARADHATGDLFSEPGALAHSTDPSTSHEAALAKKASGTIGSDQAEALRAVREHPGSTCPELAGGDEVTRQRYGRRLPELRRAGLINITGKRDGCSTYRITELGQARLAIWECRHPTGCSVTDAAQEVINRCEG